MPTISTFGETLVFKHGANTIGQVLDFSHDATRADINVTHTASTTKEARPGKFDSGTLSVKLLGDVASANFLTMYATMKTRTLEDFSYTLTNDDTTPVSKTHSFEGFLTKCTWGSISEDNRAEIDIEIRLTGAETLS